MAFDQRNQAGGVQYEQNRAKDWSLRDTADEVDDGGARGPNSYVLRPAKQVRPEPSVGDVADAVGYVVCRRCNRIKTSTVSKAADRSKSKTVY